MSTDDYILSTNDISGIEHIVEEYNRIVKNGNFEKAIVTGALLEHALIHMHMEVVDKVDNIINKLEEKK